MPRFFCNRSGPMDDDPSQAPDKTKKTNCVVRLRPSLSKVMRVKKKMLLFRKKEEVSHMYLECYRYEIFEAWSKVRLVACFASVLFALVCWISCAFASLFVAISRTSALLPVVIDGVGSSVANTKTVCAFVLWFRIVC